ncbi:MAG: hypothetical protein COW88_02590 [Candidatus Lloydbacteria bacterium CG22_combo_CG10-13_8_21_14_all_47_15]|uniref:Septum formation initiator n=1 Tax=Candidatus Lloydbacteria bacterium CG22_combo_CG10-13_8_21_14_all_47_15 TaxID=1974635 RepID=A0A2H0CTJ9_9BACT|nr:MAG: hypothetical protein COW88_02590 [Candidatus Lloydbacteria bacterium CG22_combo_CG10-13_8_21_14_all_47_15]
MKKFQQKRRMRKVIYSTGTAVALLLVVFFLGRATLDVYEKARETKDRRLESLRRLDELKAEEAALREKLSALETERGIEETVREKFNVAKDDEEVIKLVDEAGAKEPATAAATMEEKTWWQRLFNNE